MKVSAIRTKTITASTPEALDGNIATFVATLGEAQYVDLKIAVTDVYTATIIYTS